MSRRRRYAPPPRWAWLKMLGLVAAFLVAAFLVPIANFISDASDAASTTPAPAGELAAQIRDLPSTTAAEQAALEGSYDRDAQFGGDWLDPDGNGCDARQDVLARDRDGGSPDPEHPCFIDELIVHDPYTGKALHSSKAVQIDHVVPLAVAWRSGAADWTDDQRRQFANDPANLLAVDGPTNQSKGDQTPDEWMPPNSGVWCDYTAIYVQVSTTYKIAVTDTTRTALLTNAADC